MKGDVVLSAVQLCSVGVAKLVACGKVCKCTTVAELGISCACMHLYASWYGLKHISAWFEAATAACSKTAKAVLKAVTMLVLSMLTYILTCAPSESTS